jgi:hypothetical protein
MSIVFKPWIGKEYFSQTPKILVLGESHYFKEDQKDVENFTIRVVESLGLRLEGRHKFFTIIAKILSDKPHDWLSDEASKDFWQKVAFYNFIQSSVGNNSRIRPTAEMWENSGQTFKKVIKDLEPGIVVVLGRELGANVKPMVKDLDCIFCYWTHPSTPKYFKRQEASDSFQNAKIEWASKN